MQSVVQLFWSSQHVGRDPNKSLTPTNIVQCIENMYNIINISITLYIFINNRFYSCINMQLLQIFHSSS